MRRQPSRESKRRLSINRELFTLIDQLDLYQSRLFRSNELPRWVRPDRLRMYYNRTGRRTIRALSVADGLLVVRVE